MLNFASGEGRGERGLGEWGEVARQERGEGVEGESVF